MRFLYFFILIGLPIAKIVGQDKPTPILERKITISLTNEKIVTALSQIEQVGKFSFSYNSSIISPTETISINVVNKTVREVLQLIFKGTKIYKEKNGYLILTQAPPPPKTETTVVIISGYVEDEKTGDKIADASIYDKTTLASAVTDQFGFYKLKLDKAKPVASLTISKKDYRDTLVRVTAPGNQLLNVSISPVEPDSVFIQAVTVSTPVDTLDQEEIKTFPYHSDVNVQNISDTLYRTAQVSFLPFLGSNGRLSGSVINDYSFNVLGGFSMGTNAAELGGLFNIDRGNVKAFQLAGLFNIVGGNVSGFQLAGLINANRRKTRAVQVAGLMNLNASTADGVQIAGWGNANQGKTNAAQIGGLFNFNLDSVKGVQIAGLMNVNTRSAQGAQLAGLFNVQHENYKGSQLAGLFNIATKKITGTQISGIYNLGHEVRGSQIGFLNFSDTIRGVPVGFLSFSTTGYHQIELFADEIFYTNFAFRTGVRQFYNIFTVGIKPQNLSDPFWTVGYGLGTAPRINKWLSLNFDLTSNHVSQGEFIQQLSMLNKVYAGVEIHTARKLAFTLGATLNGYFRNTTYADYPELFTDYKPHVYEYTFGDTTRMQMWLGFKAGIRFL